MHTHAHSLETAILVGKGFCADVYAWGEGRVLKLFHGRASHAQAQREYTATRAVHAAGLPAPDAFEVIEVEGRVGIVFESPGYMHWMLRCLRHVMHRSYLERSLRLHNATRRQVEAWQVPIAVAARSPNGYRWAGSGAASG